MIWLCAPLGAPLPLLLQAISASATQLGILSAVWQIATLAQVPCAFLAETMPRRKPLWAVASILHRLLWATPAVLPWLLPDQHHLWPLILIVALGLSNILANVGTASWFSWMADLVPPETAGKFWATRQSILSLVMVAATALYGWILDHFNSPPFLGFQIVFVLCSLTGVADIALHCWVHEPEHKLHQSRVGWRTRLRQPFEKKGFRILTGALAGWVAAQAVLGYTMGVPGYFSMVHLKETFGSSYSEASLLFIAACVGAVAATPALGRWIDRAGAGAVLLRLSIWGPVSMLPWLLLRPGLVEVGPLSLPSAVLWIGIAGLFQGAIYTGGLLCQYRLLQMHTAPTGRTVAMALHCSLVGTAGAIAAIGAGLLKDHLSADWLSSLRGHWTGFDILVLLHLLMVWGAVVPLSFKLQREP